MKEIAYSKTAQKALMRMPRNWAIRIRDKISAYADDPASQANNVKALQGMDGMLRLRVGDWRIVLCDGVVLEILDIKARGNAYKE
ncbi:type II toxin-antitoxin system RelE family toxin [Phaeovulum veldkampii]|uniref:Cytotoxic translational repressor of toxin-antitoxin stability system n=1 Tax=Phaeovulum veldkampii DSM 11550 TaxID=1185920 RepID=A0A2T4J8I3_9RHOB|nr:type II toxin-antitoxin system RelE/ParE family toxin [Phaeovulum veldkampii]PTE14215.1 cytotoxic translational repressor of toxin-antitoxin stability system [Phaeovulum veldkampii DSM 11550]